MPIPKRAQLPQQPTLPTLGEGDVPDFGAGVEEPDYMDIWRTRGVEPTNPKRRRRRGSRPTPPKTDYVSLIMRLMDKAVKGYGQPMENDIPYASMPKAFRQAVEESGYEGPYVSFPRDKLKDDELAFVEQTVARAQKQREAARVNIPDDMPVLEQATPESYAQRAGKRPPIVKR